MQDIDVTVIEDFREYLLKTKCIRKKGKFLAQNTALTYFNKMKATLRKAYKKGLLQTDVNAAIESIKEQESQRNFLTMEEAARLFRTPCKKEIVKRVSLFYLLTGMRYSDISKLTWEAVLTTHQLKNTLHLTAFAIRMQHCRWQQVPTFLRYRKCWGTKT